MLAQLNKSGNSTDIKTIEVNERYLSVPLPSEKLVCVRSAKNTGKTAWVGDRVEGTKLIITHRISLSDDIARRYGAQHYQKGGLDADKGSLVICIDSLPKLMEKGRIERFLDGNTTIVLDEICQQLRHLDGDTTRGKRREILEVFATLTVNSKQTIALDADLNDVAVTFLQKQGLIGESNTAIIQNSHKELREFIGFEEKETLVNELRRTIKAGKRTFIWCDTREDSIQIHDLVGKLDEQVLLVHGGNCNEMEQSEFLNDPNGYVVDMGVNHLICSPSLSTGVDLSTPHFESVFVFAANFAMIEKDILQASARVRSVKEVRFWIAEKERHQQTDWKQILQRMLDQYLREGENSWAFRLNPETAQVEVRAEERAAIEMICQMQALRNTSLNNLKKSFIAAAQEEGTVTWVKSRSEKDDKLMKRILKEVKKVGQADRKQALLNADPMDDMEYKAVADAYDTTAFIIIDEDGLETWESIRKPEQKLRIARKMLLRMVGNLEEYLPMAVEDPNHWRRAIKLQDVLRGDLERLQEKDDWEQATKFLLDRHRYVMQQNLLKALQELVDYKGYLNDHADRIRDWAKANETWISGLLGIAVPQNLDEKPIQFIVEALRQMGYSVKNTRKQVNGKRERFYEIDRESVERIEKIMKARLELKLDNFKVRVEDNPFC